MRLLHTLKSQGQNQQLIKQAPVHLQSLALPNLHRYSIDACTRSEFSPQQPQSVHTDEYVSLHTIALVPALRYSEQL